MNFNNARRRYLGLPGNNTQVISAMLRRLADDLDSGAVATDSTSDAITLNFSQDVLHRVTVDLKILPYPKNIEPEEHKPRFVGVLGEPNEHQPRLNFPLYKEE